MKGSKTTNFELDQCDYPRYYCLSCGKEEEEYDSICVECKKEEHYPETIYGV